MPGRPRPDPHDTRITGVTRTAPYVGLRVRARLHEGRSGRAAVADHAAAGRVIAQQLVRALALLLHRWLPPAARCACAVDSQLTGGPAKYVHCTIVQRVFISVSAASRSARAGPTAYTASRGCSVPDAGPASVLESARDCPAITRPCVQESRRHNTHRSARRQQGSTIGCASASIQGNAIAAHAAAQCRTRSGGCRPSA